MHELLAVLAIHLLAVMSPGPDTAMVIRSSVVYSRRTGLWTALGIALGLPVHITYCLVGIGFLIAQSLTLFTLIKVAGALYLIYLGIRTLRSRGGKVQAVAEQHRKDIGVLAALRIGFLTNVLNPKASLFFLALFSQVISPETADTTKVLYGVLMTVNTFLWFALVALLLNLAPVRRVFNRIITPLEKAMGALLVALGIRILVTAR